MTEMGYLNMQGKWVVESKEVDRQLALFKEGERIASQDKINPLNSLEELAYEIANSINWSMLTTKKDVVIEVVKVYQGFLDNGGVIDFTK